MIRHGQAPYLECSSKGDKRFSAFYARIRSRGNCTIEELYQGAKIFEDGSTGLTWKQAKGRKAVNQAEAANFYSQLWDEYLAENPALLPVLQQASGVQDIFGQPRHCCQATELWRIRENSMKEHKDFRTMPWVAIIGSREPSQEQELAVAEAIEDLHPSEVCIISGCADGIDALALLTAHNLGFITIGIVPWPNYNTHVQGFCTHVVCIDEFKDYARQEAYASVDKYHPAPDRLSQGARKLHARNYGIIRWASQVIAAPSDKPGGGGTGQGIRLAQDLNLPLTIIPAKV